ncbi:competence protein ComEC [Pseudoxanthomonas sp. LjRoot143]|uniref:ComEC/Rec2 family competence protein n=1 Tax=Pseudoxanthomonas sp. LjRoot143 TaxID=3342266 RepID=UPI0026959629
MNFEIDFLPVGEGSGDAIVVRYGNDAEGYLLHVTDGGRTDTADTVIDHIKTYYPGFFINHMVLSHADNDHACGLIGVMKKIKVEHLWMNRPWLYADQILHHFHGNFTLQGLIQDIRDRHPYLVELERLARLQGTRIHDAFQGARIGKFTVLAPSRDRYIRLIPDFGKTPDRYSTEAASLETYGLLRSLVEKAKRLFEDWDIETLARTASTSASNESCVVQHATLDGKGILLTADVGPIGLTEAWVCAQQLGLPRPGFIQVPHHGSRHNVTPDVLDRWLGKKQPPGTVIGTAYCSVGANKHDYPRAQVKNAFMRRGYPVYSTRKTGLSHFHGPGHANTSPAVAESFSFEVEPL